jgi:WD40 repeat protein
MQPRAATAFRDAVAGGDFAAALALLPALGPAGAGAARARFLLLRQKYVEAVAAGDAAGALATLRGELAPLEAAAPGGAAAPGSALQGLAAMLLQPAGGASAAAAAKPAAGREALLAELQALLPPSALLPEARLEALVEQALAAQLGRCPYHNARALRMSLFVDYAAGPEQLPTRPAQALAAHTDEVWALAFSPDGRWLASGSKDGSALLWAVPPGGGALVLSRPLLRCSAPVNLVSFAPDGALALVGAADGRLRVVEVPSGALRAEVAVGGAADAAQAAAWLPCSTRFVAATPDRQLSVHDLAAGGAAVRRVKAGQHVYDAVVSRDGGTIVSVGQDRRLRFLRLADGREAETPPEPAAVTCLSASPDGRFVAANLASGAVRLWPLGDLAAPAGLAALAAPRGGGDGAAPPADPLDALPAAPLQEFRAGGAPRPGRYVIRSALGGAGCAFVASGGEDARVHLWHRASGELLASLEGHAGTVNAVAWNPANQYMLASASDDRTVRVWVAPAAAARPAAALE